MALQLSSARTIIHRKWMMVQGTQFLSECLRFFQILDVWLVRQIARRVTSAAKANDTNCRPAARADQRASVVERGFERTIGRGSSRLLSRCRTVRRFPGIDY